MRSLPATEAGAALLHSIQDAAIYRKAVGARPRDILPQFVAEALGISLAGGMLGLALGVGIATAVTLSGVLTTAIALSTVVLALGFSLAIGLFFGIWPARRAAQPDRRAAL